MGNLRVSGGEGRNRQENYLSCNTACLHIQFTVVIYTRCIYNLNVRLFFFFLTVFSLPLTQRYAYTIIAEGYVVIKLLNKGLHVFRGYLKT